MSAPATSAKAIFLHALELTTVSGRQAYVETECGGDAELRREVEELLRHQQSMEGFLETPPTAVVESAVLLCTLAPPTASLAFLEPSSRADSLGRLGHYEILEVVGSGGMGIVLRAFDERLQRIVAIKAMAPSLAASATARQRFVREAQAAAAVNHDNVVSIYAVEEAGAVPYLVMEHIAGISLDEKLKQQAGLPLAEILRIGLQITEGLAAAHRQGLVHRDVKPGNILLQNGAERVKITDFGLARAADDVSITQGGAIAGTPAYMSPEQARGDAVDQRSDLFSLGSVLYALCTGQAPFRSGTSLGMMHRVCEGKARPIRELNPQLPEWLCEVIAKLHAKLPAERFQSAEELAAAIKCSARSQLPLLTLVSSEKAPSRGPFHRRWTIAAAAVLIVGVSLGLGDASGLTQMTATVVRILTPHGTLVVEAEDPLVKVTVADDGGVVIAGAGPLEVHLRPGSYKVQATRDGVRVPLDQDLVTITRGDKRIVKVSMAKAELPAGAGSQTERGAFVITSALGVAQQPFETLAEAISSARSGDAIEIRGNGPFHGPPYQMRINNKALVIRSGPGFHPVLLPHPEVEQADRTMILALSASLTLEGLEFQRSGTDKAAMNFVYVLGAPCRLLNCRFVVRGSGTSVGAQEASSVEIRNCEFYRGGPDFSLLHAGGAPLLIENCVLASPGTIGVNLQNWKPDQALTVVQLRHNTFALGAPLHFGPQILRKPEVRPSYQVHAVGNLFADGLCFDYGRLESGKPESPEQAQQLLKEAMHWQEQGNLWAKDVELLQFRDSYRPASAAASWKTLSSWEAFWGLSRTGSLQGTVQYHNGPPVTRLASVELSARDFRLHAESAGYRAGPHGKDLGADVDLVGPGAAYKRWKETPDYQQWLKATNP